MAWPLQVTDVNTIEIFLGLFMVIFMLTSSFITQRLILGAAPIAFLVGVIFGPTAAGLVNPPVSQSTKLILFEFSRLVLGLQSFGNAVELPKNYLSRHWKSLASIIGPIMLSGWLIAACFVKLMAPSLDWKQCLACAACFNAIDPVLAATVLQTGFARRVPTHLSNLLRCEAAANGVITTVILKLTIYIMRYPHNPRKIATEVISIGLSYQSLFGTLAGFCIGYAARRAIRAAHERDTIDRPSFLAFYLSVALFATGFGTIVGVDEVNLAFFAGIGLDNDDWYEQKTKDTFFSSAVDLMLNLGYFAFLGSCIPWASFSSEVLRIIPWRLVLGTLCIFLFRRLPAVLLFKPLIPELIMWRDAFFYGHFGPIGAGAVFSALQIHEDLISRIGSASDTDSGNVDTTRFLDQLWAIVTFVVVCSSIVHGTSVAIYTFGRHVNTLTITISFTRASTDANWMERLPRIQDRTSSTMSFSDMGQEVNPQSDRVRRPAKAYMYADTIIIEDDDGNVIKQYDAGPLDERRNTDERTGARLSARDFIRRIQELDPESHIGSLTMPEHAGLSRSIGCADGYGAGEQGETAVERKRRLAALGIIPNVDNDDDNDDDDENEDALMSGGLTAGGPNGDETGGLRLISEL